MTVPVIPDTAPFSPAQKAWLNGFLAGLFSRGGAQASPAPQPLTPLTIIYASQTGTAERLAKKTSKSAGKRGFAPTLLEASQASIDKLKTESSVLFLTSTYGDGEPPDAAKPLLGALASAAGTPFSKLRFSVCALGDSNYAKFCQAGRDLDAHLERLGGIRIAPRVDCDVGQEDKYGAWLESALAPLGQTTASASETTDETEEESHKFHEAPLLSVTRLNAAGSGKEVNHVCFSLAGSGLKYKAGDALSVTPANNPSLVSEILGLLGCDGEEAVPAKDGAGSLRKALTHFYDLGKPTSELLSLLKVAGDKTPHQVIDALLAASAGKPPLPEFLASLRRLQPRLYSISSSPSAHTGEVHLTVGAVRYEKDGRPRAGVCSTYLAERAMDDGKVLISVHENNGFRLPENGDTPIIMVGPGTGIAPFRGFVHERVATKAKGDNWLFFGDQKSSTDFLYREELLSLEKEGRLRLSLAWSRDQTEKIYVQTRMLEQAADLWNWLQRGAHVYVCGDAARMAKDVDSALHRVVETAGGKSPEEAIAYVTALKTERRYQRDVY